MKHTLTEIEENRSYATRGKICAFANAILLRNIELTKINNHAQKFEKYKFDALQMTVEHDSKSFPNHKFITSDPLL